MANRTTLVGRILTACFGWLFLGPAAGLAIAFWENEHGSISYFILGCIIGFAGAVLHPLLIYRRAKRDVHAQA